MVTLTVEASIRFRFLLLLRLFPSLEFGDFLAKLLDKLLALFLVVARDRGTDCRDKQNRNDLIHPRGDLQICPVCQTTDPEGAMRLIYEKLGSLGIY